MIVEVIYRSLVFFCSLENSTYKKYSAMAFSFIFPAVFLPIRLNANSGSWPDNCQFLFDIENNVVWFPWEFISANYWLSILNLYSVCHELDRSRECELKEMRQIFKCLLCVHYAFQVTMVDLLYLTSNFIFIVFF